MRLVYDIVFFIFCIFYLPIFFIKGKHRDGFLSRFGVVPKDVREKLFGKKVIWIHAVSVGEMAQAVKLTGALRNKYQDLCFVLTATTAAGKAFAEKHKDPRDFAIYFPVDFRSSVNAFLLAVDPKAMIILETEIWPNLLYALSKRGVPVFIMNARISDRAIGRYRLLKPLLGSVMDQIAWVGAQDDKMRSRFMELGMKPEKVMVTGNMKFDWQPSTTKKNEVEMIQQYLKMPGMFLLIAGSTHQGEEKIMFDLFKKMRAEFPFFKLLIAPRHLDRIASIEEEAQKSGVKLESFSSLAGNGNRPEAREAVFLLDKIGILADLYQIADVVYVGGSLVPKGGHNLVEPAYYEKPVVFGPYMNNFAEMVSEFKETAAAVQVRDLQSLEAEIRKLIQDSAYRNKIGAAAKKVVETNRGATEQNINAFLNAVHI